MRLLRLDQAERSARDVLFRERSYLAAGLAVFMAGVGALMIGKGIAADYFVAVPPGLLLLLFTIPVANAAWKTFLPTNWTLGIGERRAVVKLRPYPNTAFPATDVQVAEIPIAEITGARSVLFVVQGREVGNRIHTRMERYLDLRLRGADLSELRRRLRYERTFRGKGVTLIHFPVSVVGEDILRVHWRGTSSWLHPSVDEAVRLLSGRVEIELPRCVSIDLLDPPSIAPALRDEYVRSLVMAGELIEARLAAQALYGVDSGEASRMVERLEAS